MNLGGGGWTDERVETLKKLYAEKKTASQISRHLGGVTRNGVIGKLHRLGLTGNRSLAEKPAHRKSKANGETNVHRTKKAPTQAPKVSKPLPREKKVEVVSVYPKVFGTSAAVHGKHDTPGRCGFPIGEIGPGYHYCTAERAPAPNENAERPIYCTAHMKMAHQPRAATPRRNASRIGALPVSSGGRA